MSNEPFEFLSAEEANEIVSSYNKINDKFVRSYLKVTVEYEIKEAAKKGKKSVDIKIEPGQITDSTRNFIVDYLKSKGYKVDIITKTDYWRGESYDYKAFSVKWGKEN